MPGRRLGPKAFGPSTHRGAPHTHRLIDGQKIAVFASDAVSGSDSYLTATGYGGVGYGAIAYGDATAGTASPSLSLATAIDATSDADAASGIAITSADATADAEAAGLSLATTDVTSDADASTRIALTSVDAASDVDATILVALASAVDATSGADVGASQASVTAADTIAGTDTPALIAGTAADAVAAADGSGPDQTGVAADATSTADAVSLLATSFADATSTADIATGLVMASSDAVVGVDAPLLTLGAADGTAGTEAVALVTGSADVVAGSEVPALLDIGSTDATSSADVGSSSSGATPIMAADATSGADGAAVLDVTPTTQAMGEGAGWRTSEPVLRPRAPRVTSKPKLRPPVITYGRTVEDGSHAGDAESIFGASIHADAGNVVDEVAVVAIIVGDGATATDALEWFAMGVSEESLGLDRLGLTSTLSTDAAGARDGVALGLCVLDIASALNDAGAMRLPWTIEQRNAHAVLYSLDPALAAAAYRKGNVAEPRILEPVNRR